MATKASRIALAGSNISSTGEVDADLLDNIDSAAFLSLDGNGRLGIGTDSPGAKLDVVAGHIRAQNTATDAIFFEGIRTGAQTTLRIYDNANNLYIDSHSTMHFRANQTGGSGGHTSFNGSNVGIGTFSPSAKLELNVPTGDGLLINSADIATIKMKNTGGGVSNWGFATTNLAASDFGIYRSNSVGGDPITAGSAKMYFNASGNVGIGTTSPDLKLDVTHATAAEYIATFQNSGNNNQLKIGNQAQGYLNIQGARIDNGNPYNFSLQSDGGNVGIGTTIPSRNQYGSVDPKLHVNTAGTSGAYDLVARFQAGPDSNDSGAAILINHTNDRGLLIEAGREIGDTGIAHFSVLNSGAAKERILTLKQGGNVGIGTTSPGEKLHVEGSIRASGNIGVTQTDGDYLAKLYQSSADGFLELYTGEATPVSRVKLSAYGNSYIAPSTTSGLGVGTTAPSERLHVVGDIQQQSTHNGSDRCVEAFFNIFTNTSYNTVWTANISTDHQGMFYEVICYGGDWGSHSSARVIKRGFVNGYNGYSGHQEIESAGPYASNISGQLLWSGNNVTYQMRLDTGSVTLRGMVRLIGHFTSYTVY